MGSFTACEAAQNQQFTLSNRSDMQERHEEWRLVWLWASQEETRRQRLELRATPVTTPADVTCTSPTRLYDTRRPGRPRSHQLDTLCYSSWSHETVWCNWRIMGLDDGAEPNRTEVMSGRTVFTSRSVNGGFIWTGSEVMWDPRWVNVLVFFCVELFVSRNSDGGRGLSLEWTRMTSGVDPWRDGSRSSLPLFC